MSIDKKDSDFRSLEEKWNLVDALWKGTDGMRAAGQLYLPKFAGETDQNYTQRLMYTDLFNAYRKAVKDNVAKIMARNVSVENASDTIRAFEEDVDTQGRDLSTFVGDVLTNAMHHGVAYILVDMPRVEEPVTLADYLTGEIRPYFVDIAATQVLSVRSRKTLRGEYLAYFKYAEQVTEEFGSDKSSNKYTTQIREFTRTEEGNVEFAVYRKNDEGWYVVDMGVMEGLSQIPIVPLYGNRTGYMIGEPVLMDLAELNVSHWKSTSDQKWALHYARAPILLAKMLSTVDDEGKVVEINVGPNSLVHGMTPESDLKYVEHSGAAIAAGRQELKDLEDQMAVLGLELVLNRTGALTATEAAINSANQNSSLKKIAMDAENSIAMALYIAHLYYGIESEFEGLEVNLNKEYLPVAGEKGINEVLTLYRSGLISAGDLLKEFKRRQLLSPTHEIEEERFEQFDNPANNGTS